MENSKRPIGGRGPMGGGMGGNSGEKAKDFTGAMKKLIKFCQPYFVPIVIALIFAIAGVVLTILGPNQLSAMTNAIEAGFVTGSTDFSTITNIAIKLVIYYGGSFIFVLIQGVIMTYTTQKISKMLRYSISDKINHLPLAYFQRTTTGNILSRVTNDVDSIGDTLNRSVVQFISAIVMLIGSAIMMLTTSWIMALTAIGSSLLGFVLMIVIMKKSQKYFLRKQNALGGLDGHVEEVYSGHSIVKTYNGEDEARKSFIRFNNELYDSNWKSQFLSGLMMPIMNFIGNFGYVAVCVVGAILTINNQISFGVIIAFMIYIRLFTNPMAQIAQAMTSLQATSAASERVFEFLGEKDMSDESQKTAVIENTKGEVEFDHVRFGYVPDKVIIHDFSRHVQPGQKVAIVGPTGAGKTTMVNLLMRFYELNSGCIKIDGVPTIDLTRTNVHALFGMVLQDTWLFQGTIKENIIYSMKNVSDEDVVNACEAAGIDHFIMTLPKGYDTIVNEQVSLSEGQKQLITIARAMVENSPMLILDEATSSVDTRTEIMIQKAMDKLTQGRTSFVIAHRLSTIKNADIILVMKDGDIIESGKHAELLAQGGFYAELYNSQFEKI